MTIEFTLEDSIQFLPNLSIEHRTRLYADLRRMGEGLDYYFDYSGSERLQGDSLAGAPFVSFENSHPCLLTARVLIVSNSCDIDQRNSRASPGSVTVAPLVRLVRFEEMLTDAGLARETIDRKLDAIRKQQVSNAFYLPAGRQISDESIVFLDQMQSLPMPVFEANSPQKLSSLSQPAYWLLLMKLSVHFCRQHDEVVRYDQAA